MPRTTKAGSTTSRTAPAKPRAKRVRARATHLDVKLTADRLIVRVPGNGERKSAGGLLIPATAAPAPKRLEWGDVELVGPDVRVAATGDRVLFLPAAGLDVELEGQELVLLRERDVQAVSAGTSDDLKDRAPGQYL